MSEPTHPPYASTVLNGYRTLNRWLDINAQNGPLGRTQTYVTVPAFSVAVNWLGYSDIVAAFNYEGPNNFTLKGIAGNLVNSLSNIPSTPNFMLCIMWVDSAGKAHRYAIYKNVGEVIYFNLPLYTGQMIGKNFRFEIWSTNSSPAVLLAPINIYTSVLGLQDYRFGVDGALVNPDTVSVSFNDVANQITPDLTNATLWFNPDDLVAGAISSWNDRINTTNLSQGTGGNQPTCVANGLNGHNLVQVSGAKSMVGSFNKTVGVYYVVFEIITYDNNNSFLSFTNAGGGGGSSKSNFATKNSGVLLQTTLGNLNNTNLTLTTAALNVFYLAEINILSGTITLFNLLTGLSLEIESGTADVLTTNAGLIFGNAGAGNYKFGDMLAYGSLSYNRKQTLDYFFRKYNSTAFSLPINFPPTSVPEWNGQIPSLLPTNLAL